ncbi:MAG: hypothetical protein AAGH15_19615 [Myxococcota bacterium]
MNEQKIERLRRFLASVEEALAAQDRAHPELLRTLGRPPARHGAPRVAPRALRA